MNMITLYTMCKGHMTSGHQWIWLVESKNSWQSGSRLVWVIRKLKPHGPEAQLCGLSVGGLLHSSLPSEGCW